MRVRVLTKSVSLKRNRRKCSDISRLRLSNVRGPRYARLNRRLRSHSPRLSIRTVFLLVFFKYRDIRSMRINRRRRRAIDENEEMVLLAESGRFAPRGLVRLISKDGKEIDAPLGTRTFVPNRIESNRIAYYLLECAASCQSFRIYSIQQQRI